MPRPRSQVAPNLTKEEVVILAGMIEDTANAERSDWSPRLIAQMQSEAPPPDYSDNEAKSGSTPNTPPTPLSKAQIGKCGELLVQLQLLRHGLESAHLTTDSGIDLVTYAPGQERAVTIQVKTNLRAKPSGGKGKDALDWRIPVGCPAELVALVDLTSNSVWIFSMEQIRSLSQQTTEGQHHLYMWVDPTVKHRKDGRITHQSEFQHHLLESQIQGIFGISV